MYTDGTEEYSSQYMQQWAKIEGISVEELAKQNGLSLVEGKTEGSAETTPPMGPTEMAAGDSSSADSSLESLETDPFEIAKSRLSNLKLTTEEINAYIEEANAEPVKKAVYQTSSDGVTVATGEYYDSFVYDNYVPEARRKVARNKGIDISEVKEADWIAEAKNMYVEGRKKADLESRVKDIMEDFEDEYMGFGDYFKKHVGTTLHWLSEATSASTPGLKAYLDVASESIAGEGEIELEKKREELKAYYENLSEQNVKNYEQAEKNLDGYAAVITEADTRLRQLSDKAKYSPTGITEAEREEYNALVGTRNTTAELAQEEIAKVNNLIENAETFGEIVDMVGRSYDNIEVFSNRVESTIDRTAAGLLTFGSELTPDQIKKRVSGSDGENHEPIWGAGLTEAMKLTAEDFYKEAEALDNRSRRRQAITEIGSAGDLLDFSVDLFSEQLVNTAITMSMPAAGLVIVSSSAAGQKFHDMEIEIANGEKISAAQFYSAGLLYGMGEYITEKISLKQAQSAFKAVGKATKLGKRVGKLDLDNIEGLTNFVPTIEAAAKSWAIKTNQEGAAELGSQLFSNVADKYILGKDIALTEGLTESYLSGAFMSGVGFSSPALVIDLHRAVTKGSELRAMQDRAKEIMSLKTRLDELNNAPELTPDVEAAKNEIQARIDELAMENVNAFVSNANRVDDLSRSDKRALLDLDAKMYRFRGAIEKINNNAELSKEEKVAMIERYANALDTMQGQKDSILGAAENSRAKANARSLQMKLVAAKGLNFTYINGTNAEDAVNQAIEAVDNSNLSDEDKQALKAELLKAKNEEGMNGFYIGAEYGLPISLTTEEGAKRNSSVVAHEVSHATLFKALVAADADMIGLANDLEAYMIKTYGDIARAKFAKVQVTYTKEGGFTDAQIAEEKMAAVVELARKYDLEANKHKTLHAKLIARWNKLSKSEKPTTEIKTGKDVLNAIISFNSSFDKGEVSGLFSDIVSGKVEVTNKAVQKEAQKASKATMSISAAAQRAKDVLAKVSANMDFFDPNSPLIARVLPGMIDAQASVYKAKGLQFDMQELQAEVLLRLYEAGDIAKFDGRGELYGYLNQRIKFRILDAFKQNPDIVENFSETDIEGLEGKAVQKVAVEPVEETATAPEKPKYRSLLESKVVSPEGLKTISQKVMSVVRVMKKRMDESVSKNVTVKPYIAELKKDFGKQVDIVLKKEMGGLKDRQLQKWLLKNKKAILENMTTTWLMTAMPNAVQKKVNGEWTSDWQGKKIDRETVSTDNAGRTSGAELVRRLPKASIRMSDADFLSNFFNQDGSLIRGRKESLAKAMAEEVGFELFVQELQNEESEIRQAFEQRQDLLSVELTEAYVVEVARDVERGNVKFSIDVETMRSKEFISLVGQVARQVTKKDIDAVVDDEGNLVESAVSKLNIPEQWKPAIAELILQAHNEGIIQDEKAITFMVGVKASEIIPESQKPKKGLTKRSPKAELEKYADEVVKLGKALGAQVMSAWDVQGLGFFNRLLDPAAIKQETGKPGAFYNKMTSMLSSLKASALPSDINLSAVSLMNKTKGLMKEVAKIQNMDISKAEKIKLYEESGLAEKITQANIHNKRLFKHIIKTAINLVKTSEVSGLTYIQMLQAQTNAVNGLRALSGLTFITFKDGPQGNMKGEHLADNAGTMLELAELPFLPISEADLDARLDAVLESHDQWIENRETLDYVDAFGKNNPNKERRILTLPASELADVYHYSGRPAAEVIVEIVEARKKTKALFSKTSPDKLASARETFVESAKMSQGAPRAVFMVGGPGAGKTNVGKGLKLGRRGYKVVNQDLALEPMKSEAGLPANEQDYSKEQRSLRAKLGAAARKAADLKMEQYKNNRESMVVDGTGASYNATMKKINALREAGYEVSIVFANTSKDEAIARNKARAERALPDFIVERTWEAVQESAKLYKEEFGGKFYELNTNEIKLGEDLPKPFLDKLYSDLEVGPAKYSKALSEEFNEMIERRYGVGKQKVFSKVQAELRGAKKGRFKFFIAPGADDFRGLVHYAFAGKGKQGDADMAWIEEKLMTPYFKGVEAINRVRQQIKRDFKEAIKIFRKEYKMLGKKIGDTGFTYDQALRVWMWNRQGTPVPGLSKRDKKILLDAINKNPELVQFADALLVVSRKPEWTEPGEYWQTQTALSDLNSMTEKIGRKKYLQEFIENAEIIFSEDNLNKIEAIKGRAHREAIEDALYSMKSGTNRPTGNNATVNRFINWINGSTGAIMFFNRRSALLQMLSFPNFVNWSDNNPAKAAAAFANQKQYWSDWAMIFNSDKLKERRSGLKTDVSESELANVANRSKGDPRAILAWLLKQGFLPTQIADSFAIATGGATFYRNRVNTYLKQGMNQKAAEEQAWLDFTKKSDEAQQSSDPALVSQLQRSVLGRLVFAFANTPMQYTRLLKKAALDLAAGRGSKMENISKIAYYGFAQNLIFSSLQSALFALIPGFDDEDEELTDAEAEKKAAKEEKKISRVLNGMVDTLLRGSGVYGAVAVTLKNLWNEYMTQEQKGFLADHTYTVLQATSISPPINSKLRKIYSAIQTRKFEQDELEVRPWGIATDGRPNLGPGWSITGSLVSGALNVPLDRVVDELNSIGEAMDKRNTTWQRIALALGWKTWDVGAEDEEGNLIKAAGKEKRKQEGIEKAKKTRQATQEKKKKEQDALLDDEFKKIGDELRKQRMSK